MITQRYFIETAFTIETTEDDLNRPTGLLQKYWICDSYIRFPISEKEAEDACLGENLDDLFNFKLDMLNEELHQFEQQNDQDDLPF